MKVLSEEQVYQITAGSIFDPGSKRLAASHETLRAQVWMLERALKANQESNSYLRKNEHLSDGSVNGVDRVMELTEEALESARKLDHG